MPPKARTSIKDVQKPGEPTEVRQDASADVTAEPPADEPSGENAKPAAHAPQPGVYRFTWPYSCVYNLPGQTSKTVEPGDEVFWPDGAPDALWEFVSADEPAPAPSNDTPRE